MSADQQEPEPTTNGDLSTDAVSRRTNQNKSVNISNAGSEGFENCDLHTKAKIDKCVSEFVEKYPQRALMRIATGDRRKLRREYAEVEQVEWREDLRLSEEEYKDIQLPDTRPSGVRDGEVTPPIWAKAMKQLLHKYAATKETTIHLDKTLFDKRETYEVAAKSRWQPEYQKKYKAQLDGWLRETTGGDRPTGGETEASFDNPHLGMITLSGSSVPDERRIGAVDMFDELNSTWSDHTYHAVRNTLRSLGFDADEWHYDRRAEPHTNKRGDKTGTNACYGHEHVILVVDGEVTAEELRPIVETHVNHCEFAGKSAHGEDAIEVTTPDEKDDISGYVADYASLKPVDLLDREPEYQAFAAAASAANYRTFTRSEAARQAAEVDKCRQRFESDKSAQQLDHGEEVRYDDGDILCTECDCTHDIDQNQTVAECRKPDNADTTPPEPTVADGGHEIPTDESRRQQLKEQWQDANAAASIGESTERTRVRRRIQMVKDAHPDKDAIELAAKFDAIDHIDIVRQVLEDKEELTNFDEPVGFGQDRAPEWADPDWKVNKIEVRGETHPAGGGNGMSYVETTDYVERFADVIDDKHWYRCNCGVRMWGHEMAKHLGHEHGLETKKQARLSVETETYNSD
jgi:hypothetical protein